VFPCFREKLLFWFPVKFVGGLLLNAAAIGILVCILVLVFCNRAEVAAWSMVSLMLLVCGIYYPVSILPAWVQVIARCVPLTYLLEYFCEFYGFTLAGAHEEGIKDETNKKFLFLLTDN